MTGLYLRYAQAGDDLMTAAPGRHRRAEWETTGGDKQPCLLIASATGARQ